MFVEILYLHGMSYDKFKETSRRRVVGYDFIANV